MFAHVHGTGRFYGSHAGAWYKLIHEGSTYTNLHPEVATITTDIDFNQPVNTLTMTGNVTFTESNKAEGKSCLLKLETSGNTPTFSGNIKWAGDEEPTWADHGYWVVSFICHDGTTVFASATGHTI
jgi:hypothetical protein